MIFYYKNDRTSRKQKRLLTVVVHNGLANRLLPLVSCLRLAKQSGRLLNVIFNGTPVRSCIRYDGAPCKYYDLFEKMRKILWWIVTQMGLFMTVRIILNIG